MLDELSIRRSTAADLPRLLEIWRRAVDATHHFLKPADRVEIDRLVETQYLPDAVLNVAVDHDGQPLAFLGGGGRTIDSLFVDPDAHRRGIGTMLVEHFAAGGSGAIRVEVNEQNEDARRFYEKLGFKVLRRSSVDTDGRPYPLLHLVR